MNNEPNGCDKLYDMVCNIVTGLAFVGVLVWLGVL